MNKIMRPEQQYIDLYAQAEALLRTHSTEPLNRLRARAFADFERLGFPTRRQEDCKYKTASTPTCPAPSSRTTA